MVQAAAIAFGMFGLIKWIERAAPSTSRPSSIRIWVASPGFSVHATAGIMVLPVIALLLLISSFFAKVPGGIKWALIVFGVTVLQVALGLFSHDSPASAGCTARTR